MNILKMFQKKPVYSINSNDSGFNILESAINCVAPIKWHDILIINAFKRDMVIVDLVCFQITTIKHLTYEINEEMEGFDLLEKELNEHLTGFDMTWRKKVIKPAFSYNFTEIYRQTGYQGGTEGDALIFPQKNGHLG